MAFGLVFAPPSFSRVRSFPPAESLRCLGRMLRAAEALLDAFRKLLASLFSGMGLGEDDGRAHFIGVEQSSTLSCMGMGR